MITTCIGVPTARSAGLLCTHLQAYKRCLQTLTVRKNGKDCHKLYNTIEREWRATMYLYINLQALQLYRNSEREW